MRKRKIRSRGLRNSRLATQVKGNKIIDSLSRFEKTWLLIPIIFYAVGYFIHNSYLSNFYTFDFEIIQAKYIYIGVLFVFYLTLFIVFLSIRVWLDKENRIPSFLKFATWILRLALIIVIVYILLTASTDNVRKIRTLASENELFKYSSIFTLVTLCFYFVWLFNIVPFGLLKRRTYDIILRYLYLLSIIPITYTFYIIYTNDIYFKSIIDFLRSPLLVTVVAFGFILNVIKLKFDKKYSNLTNFVLGLLLIFIFFFTMIYYSHHIYRHIPSNFGGAKSTYAIIYTETDTINCELLNENSDWLLINSTNKMVYERIRVELIKYIKISEDPIYEPVKYKKGTKSTPTYEE